MLSKFKHQIVFIAYLLYETPQQRSAAVVDINKLRNYCLNQNHLKGKHKARVFVSALGITASGAEELQEILLRVAVTNDAIPLEEDAYGQRYRLDFVMIRGELQATVRSGWIVRTGEDFPRLTSCFVV